MGIINTNLSTSGLVQKYIGSAYDIVKSVADNMASVIACANNVGGSSGAISSVIPPENPTEGQGWFNENDGQLYTWYVSPANGNSQWVRDNSN